MTKKHVQWASNGVLLANLVTLGCKKKDICLHSLGILSNKMSYNFWLSLFLQKKKVTIFVFFEILVPNIFKNIS